MRQNPIRLFGVTIAFVPGAAFIAVTMWGISLAGYEFLPNQNVQSWPEIVGYVTIYAAVAGLIVDLVRLIAAVSWRPAPVYRLTAGKFD